jgi:hypothetical protein
MLNNSSPRNGPPIMNPNRVWLLIDGVMVRIRKTANIPRMNSAGQSRGPRFGLRDGGGCSGVSPLCGKVETSGWAVTAHPRGEVAWKLGKINGKF